MEALLERIKNCQTMRELDELRIDIIKAADRGEDFETLQRAFIKKQNSLRRNGHTRWKEGYSLNEVIDEQKKEGKISGKNKN